MKKIALITGGSRGLGKHSALALADKGVDVIITYHHNRQAAQEVVQKIIQPKKGGLRPSVGLTSCSEVKTSQMGSSLNTWLTEFESYWFSNLRDISLIQS